jgi:hypothetical protein
VDCPRTFLVSQGAKKKKFKGSQLEPVSLRLHCSGSLNGGEVGDRMEKGKRCFMNRVLSCASDQHRVCFGTSFGLHCCILHA